MASFQESVKVFKETGLANSEILEMMRDSVDGQINESLSVPKISLKNSLNKSERETPKESTNVNTEHPPPVKGRWTLSAQRKTPEFKKRSSRLTQALLGEREELLSF